MDAYDPDAVGRRTPEQSGSLEGGAAFIGVLALATLLWVTLLSGVPLPFAGKMAVSLLVALVVGWVVLRRVRQRQERIIAAALSGRRAQAAQEREKQLAEFRAREETGR